MSLADGAITVLSLDVVRRLLVKTGGTLDGVVDLSPPKFALKAYYQDETRLSALSGLRHVAACENDKEYFTRKVRRVVLSGNDLGSYGEVGGNLLELRVFRRSVECIFAENCNLETLGWHPEKKFMNLVELDLARNFLVEVPDLAACPKLRILNLRNNEITKFGKLGSNPTLMNVDLSGNKLDYESVMDMKQDMKTGLGELSSLLSLKLEKNPLTFRLELKDRYRDVTMFSITKCRLTYLDGPINEEIIQRAKKIESRPEIASALLSPRSSQVSTATPSSINNSKTPGFAGFVPKLRRTTNGARDIQADLTFPCTLSDLDAMLESCLMSSSEASFELDKLLVEANRVVQAGGGGLFLQEEQGSKAALLTQDFLQKTIALSERRPELRKRILTVLAVLCRVEEEQEFGQACFRQLRVFMGANEETKEQVVLVVSETIPLSTLADIRLVGEMTEMAEKTSCPELLSRGPAVSFVVSQLRNPMLHTPNKRSEREICFHFLAVASLDDKARQRFGQESIGDILAPEFDKPSSPLVRRWVLDTVRNLSAGGVRNGRRSSSLVFADFVVTPPLRLHRNLLRELDAQRDSDVVMALQIDVLVVLLERSKLAFTDLCASPGINALYQVLGRFFLPKEAKFLLTEAATYRAVASLLTTSTQNWCPLVTATSTRTRKDIIEEMHKLVIMDKDVCIILEFFRQDSLQYGECWTAAKYEEEVAPPLFKDLFDPKMHNLLVALIDLVRAFNQAAQTGLVMAKTISDRMNTRGRETRLFACLEIPSDTVRLAAARCLDTVKLSQFDSNEIQFLLKLLKEMRDVTAGRTEEVLSVSLGILTKLSKQGGLEFEHKFGKTSVEVCLKLLEMNVNRETRGMERETDEKRLLTLACLKLLLQATGKINVATQQYMLSDGIVAKLYKILTLEDGMFDRKSPITHDPVLVELTSFSVTNLVNVFVSVNPNGPVAARVLRRIGNLLTFNRDSMLVPKVEASVERYPQAKQWVQVESQLEREMDLESWSVLYHALRPVQTTLEQAEEEDEWRRKQHEQFHSAACLHQILQRLAKTSGKQVFLQQQQPLIAPFSPINPRLGHPSATFGQLLDRHLMCERERTNNLDTGGDLRSLQAVLSPEQVLEAQKDFSNEDVVDQLEYFETLAAALRVLFACLKFGTQESMHYAQQTLREPSNFALLVELFFGPREGTQFARLRLGTKFFLVMEAVLGLPPLRRQESLKQLQPFNAVVFSYADRAMGLLRKRLQFQSRLAPGDEFLVKACMSVCATVSHQLEYLVGELDFNPEDAFRELVPSSLLSSALQLLLFDMAPKKHQVGASLQRRNQFGETVEDEAREKTIIFLSYCLRHSPPHRYSIIEFLIRSNTVDPFPVRRILIQELLKRTHKIGSTQRMALEYSLSEPDTKQEEEETLVVAAPVEKAVMETATENNEAPSWFAWCNGTARKPPVVAASPALTPPPEVRRLSSLEVMNRALDKVPNPFAHLHLGGGPWSRFPSPPVPTASVADEGWTMDRVGPRARVVSHSFVMYCDAQNAEQNKSKVWFYESCLVLTSEEYCLFRVLPADFDFPQRWKLIWKRPYRALVRLALGSCRLHLAHRDSDWATTESEVVTLFTPSRSSAKELAASFYELNLAWHALFNLTQTASASSLLPPPPLVGIENAHTERFRVANCMSSSPSAMLQSVSSGMMFCDLVRFCLGEKEEAWQLGMALLQHDTLVMLNKREWVLDDTMGKPGTVEVLALFELAPKNQVLKPLLRVVDFALNAEPPSPALVLEFGTPSDKRSVAIAFLDDLTRQVWRKYLTERFFKVLS
ncbi:hypothetical protein BASA81_001412 [Batrachochytrium salamandrivorans]|nr:hypothetical protein BASA81_001412 [Batrachochytrium salamandrivorans]